MKEKFIIFLKKHHCYKKYFLYTKQNHGEEIDTFLISESGNGFLSGAFVWGRANEENSYEQKDHDYWQRLDKLWKKEGV